MNGRIVFAGLYELRFTPEGFTLRDAVDGRWLIDASGIRDDGRFRIGRYTTKQIHDIEETNPTYVIARLAIPKAPGRMRNRSRVRKTKG